MGLATVYVGVIGLGPRRFYFRDDIALYKQNKRRFKWWF